MGFCSVILYLISKLSNLFFLQPVIPRGTVFHSLLPEDATILPSVVSWSLWALPACLSHCSTSSRALFFTHVGSEGFWRDDLILTVASAWALAGLGVWVPTPRSWAPAQAHGSGLLPGPDKRWAYINSPDPQPLLDDACWYRDPSAPLCVCRAPDLLPVMNMGQPTLTIVGFLLPLSFKVTALFLVFSVFFFYVLINTFLKSFFLYVLRRKGSYNLCFIQHLDPSDYSKL